MKQSLAAILNAIERERGGKAIAFAASSLDIGLLPALYDIVEEISPADPLDVVIHCRGGDVTAAWRLARILTDATDHLAFIVPFYCTSAGAIMTLGGDEIIAGSTAVFSPVDPQLASSADSDGHAQSMVSAEDVRLLGQAYADWFGLESDLAKKEALARLSDHIFPTTLTSFYRATQEVKSVCTDILSIRADRYSESQITNIVTQLTSGYHSHYYPVSSADLSALTLPVKRNPQVEKLAWEASKLIRNVVGSGLRATAADGWTDALIATTERTLVRRKTPNRIEASWEETSI